MNKSVVVSADLIAMEVVLTSCFLFLVFRSFLSNIQEEEKDGKVLDID